MYAIKIIPNKRKMDDWFLYRDPDELVVQCWNEKEDAENFMKKLNYDLCEITEDIPEILYYCLKPVIESTLPIVKREIVVDSEVLSGNEIQLTDSDYSGKQRVTIAATNQFNYTLKEPPETLSYTTPSFISYEKDSPTANGYIANF